MRLALLLLLVVCSAAARAQAEFGAAVAGVATVPDASARGFSAINLRYDGTYWALPAGGPSVFQHLYIDWRNGSARILATQQLPGPVRAMQVLESSAWFADDRGPHLIETDLRGHLLGRYAALLDGEVVSAAALRRGFGGLAVSRDARFLYAAFEGPLWREGRWETDDAGREFVRLLEFELATRRWSGRSLRYPLEASGHTLADVRFVDSRTALVVERGERFRRIYRVLVEGEALAKVAFVDLQAASLGTVEGLDLIDPGYLLLSSGDRRELVLLRAPDLVFPAFDRSRP